jgi:N-acetylneuraminate synthase
MFSNKVQIIAEAGVNHNGDPEMAHQLIDVAAEAGADVVKFQTFKTENVVTRGASKASYQKSNTSINESQFEMIKKLELDYKVHNKLFDYCQKKKIEFLSTAFDFDSLNFLVDGIGLKILKIPSGEITNGPLLLAHAQTGCNLILSTGMSLLGEIEEALSVLAFGLLVGPVESTVKPSRESFQEAYFSDEGQKILKEKVTVLHCTTEYPAPLREINLNAMIALRSAFNLKVGYSDHSAGIHIPVAATAMGATIVEKHFTLNKELPGPDHKASLNPGEFKAMVDAIREVELALGSGVKIPTPSEFKNRVIARKSLVAAKDVDSYETWDNINLTCKRPGSGVSPMKYWEYIGRKITQRYKADELISKAVNQKNE